MITAIKKLYEELNTEFHLEDVKNDYLTQHTARNGKEVLWYLDEANNKAIYIDDCIILAEDEIENQLC